MSAPFPEDFPHKGWIKGWIKGDEAILRESLFWYVNRKEKDAIHAGIIESHFVITNCGQHWRRDTVRVMAIKMGWNDIPPTCKNCRRIWGT